MTLTEYAIIIGANLAIQAILFGLCWLFDITPASCSQFKDDYGTPQ